MPGREISTTDIVSDSLRQGKKVFIPYIHPDKDNPKFKIIDMLRLKDEADLHSLKPDAWGIPSLQPDSIETRENALGGNGISGSDSVEQQPAQLDLIFMPGVAFDRSSNRLGHGKGFYDRYLSRVLQKTEQSQSRRFPKLGEFMSV